MPASPSPSPALWYDVASGALLTDFCASIPLLADLPLKIRLQAARLLEDGNGARSLLGRACLRGAIRAATHLGAHGGDWNLILALAGLHPGVAWYFSTPHQPQAAQALAQLIGQLAVGPCHRALAVSAPFSWCPGTLPALSNWQVSVLNQAASAHLFCDILQYQLIASRGETVRWLPAGLRVVMDPDAPAYWRWLIPVVQRHEDFPHMCDLLFSPLWVVDDPRREANDWNLVSFCNAMSHVEAVAPDRGLESLFMQDGGHAWLGRMRSTLGHDGFYRQPSEEQSSRTLPPPPA